MFYFSVVVSCLWRDLSSVLIIGQRVTCAKQSHPVSQDGLEVAPVHENRPVLQSLFLL